MAKMVHCTYTTVWKSVHLITLLIKEFSKICRKFIKFYMWAKTVNRVRTEPNFKTKFELFLNIFVQFPKGSWFYKITFFFSDYCRLSYYHYRNFFFFLNSWNDEARSIGKILRKMMVVEVSSLRYWPDRGLAECVACFYCLYTSTQFSLSALG